LKKLCFRALHAPFNIEIFNFYFSFESSHFQSFSNFDRFFKLVHFYIDDCRPFLPGKIVQLWQTINLPKRCLVSKPCWILTFFLQTDKKIIFIEVEILNLRSPKISVCSRVFLHLSAQPRYIKLIRRNIFKYHYYERYHLTNLHLFAYKIRRYWICLSIICLLIIFITIICPTIIWPTIISLTRFF